MRERTDSEFETDRDGTSFNLPGSKNATFDQRDSQNCTPAHEMEQDDGAGVPYQSSMCIAKDVLIKPRKQSDTSFIPKFSNMKKSASLIVRRNMVVPKISVYDSEFMDLVTEAKENERSSPSRSR